MKKIVDIKMNNIRVKETVIEKIKDLLNKIEIEEVSMIGFFTLNKDGSLDHSTHSLDSPKTNIYNVVGMLEVIKTEYLLDATLDG